jgi:hypothetical protein
LEWIQGWICRVFIRFNLCPFNSNRLTIAI